MIICRDEEERVRQIDEFTKTVEGLMSRVEIDDTNVIEDVKQKTIHPFLHAAMSSIEEEDYENAIEMLKATIEVSSETGDMYTVGLALFNLGSAYAMLSQTERALDSYRRAQGIFLQMGLQDLVAVVERNITAIQA
jgi:tetratricopeptide (TPR) repeat protein